MIVIIFVLATFGYGFAQNLNEPCTNLRGEPGRCVFLRECQPLLDIYKKRNPSYQESEFFYGSRCSGTSNNGKPLLCCHPASSTTTSATLPRPPADCGLEQPDRIYGGNATALGEYPWTALLMYSRDDGSVESGCGASLLNSRYVVTAAHCIRQISSDWTLTRVRLGEHDLSNDGPDCNRDGCADVPVEVGVEKVIVHEDYNATEPGQFNDIALVRFDRDVGFSDYIDPICLPIEESMRNMNHTERKAIAAGWGKTETNQTSDVKLKVMLNMVDHESCAKVYKRAKIVLRDTQLCAGGTEGKDTCGGDSGGPLMSLIDGNNYLIGVISLGAENCGTKNVPALYTNVAKFIDWIERNLE